MDKEPAEDERKEAPEELPEIEPASGQDRVHAVAVFPFEMIPIHPVVRFQVADDRLDRRSSLQPSSDRLVLPRRHVNGFLRQRLLRPFVSPVAEHVLHRPSRQSLRLADRTFQCVPIERISATFPIWVNLTAQTSDTMTRQADAATYTINGVAGDNAIVCFYISASILTSGRPWIHLGAAAGDAGNLVSVLYQLDGARYQQVTPPTAIA